MARHANCSADVAFIVAHDVCPTPSGYWRYVCDILSIASGKEEDGGNEITTIFYSYVIITREGETSFITNMNTGNLQDNTWAIYKTKQDDASGPPLI